MRNFGYLLIVNNDSNKKYHNMAQLLASSIKKTQPKGYDKVCLITDDSYYHKHQDLMYDLVKVKEGVKGWDQRNYMFELSPFQHTICLDVDMLITRDISHWVDHFINKTSGLIITDTVLKYNNEVITNLSCRPGYKENDIPVLYSGFTYFNKESSTASNFFKLVSYITEHKDEFKRLYMSKKYPPQIGTDEAFSIATYILGIENEVTTNTSFPKFVHLKTNLQDLKIQSINLDLGYHIDSNANISIGTFSQNEIIHYSEKDFPTAELNYLYKNQLLEGFKNV
jgi:hypothetical protein